MFNSDNNIIWRTTMKDHHIKMLYDKIAYCHHLTRFWDKINSTSVSIWRCWILEDHDGKKFHEPGTYETFKQWIDDNCYTSDPKFMLGLFYHDIGGVSGGSCWDSSDPQPYYNDEPAPVLKHTDLKLMFGDDYVQDFDFNHIVISEREYYGNRTDSRYTGIMLNDLYDTLKAIEYENNTRNITLLVGLPGCGKTTYGNLMCCIGEGDLCFVDDASLNVGSLNSSISHKNIIIADPLLCELTRQEMVDSLTKMFPDYNLNIKVIWFEKDVIGSLANCQHRDPFDSKKVEGLIKQLGKVYKIDATKDDVIIPCYRAEVYNTIPTRNIFK